VNSLIGRFSIKDEIEIENAREIISKIRAGNLEKKCKWIPTSGNCGLEKEPEPFDCLLCLSDGLLIYGTKTLETFAYIQTTLPIAEKLLHAADKQAKIMDGLQRLFKDCYSEYMKSLKGIRGNVFIQDTKPPP
jgi:hypothetical protein